MRGDNDLQYQLGHLTRGKPCKLGAIFCQIGEERQKIRGSSQAQNDELFTALALHIEHPME